MRLRDLLLPYIIACVGFATYAQDTEVTYLERTGNNGSSRIFAVTINFSKKTKKTDDVYVYGDDGKEVKLKQEEYVCRNVLNAILFDGVENYNEGKPLVANPNDSFAKSLVNPKTKTFVTYFREIQPEHNPLTSTAKVYHYIVELNHYNLLRLLEMRGSRPKTKD